MTSRLVGLVAAVLVIAFPAVSQAQGATTIADAPTIQYDTLVSGGGPPREYWRFDAFSGDRLTFRWDQAADPSGLKNYFLRIFDPSVDDFRLRDATPLFTEYVAEGKSEFRYIVPFTGLGTMEYLCRDVGSECDVSPAYSFVASVEHKTAVVWRKSPTRVRSGRRRFAVVVSVQSPAGAPAGNCLFDRIVRRSSRRVATVRVRSGVCKARLSTGRKGIVRFRARFLPETGWLASSAMSPAVRTRRG